MKENILAFPGINRARKTLDTPAIAQPSISAQVHKLITTPHFHVYEERFGKNRGLFEPFFKILLSIKKITIIERGMDVPNTFLCVTSESSGIYGITVRDFLDMTEPTKGMTKESDIVQYITSNLKGRGISIEYHKEEDYVDPAMDEEGLSLFHPEDEPLIWELSSGNMGHCRLFLNITEDDGLLYFYDEFKEPENVSLLHLFSLSRREFVCNDIGLEEDLFLELSVHENDNILITPIPLTYIDRILDAAILRKYPDYGKKYSSPQKRIDSFYTDEVYPLLRT